MQIGLIGLGKMGANMAERIRRAGHEVVGFDRSDKAPRDVTSVEELVGKLTAPRAVWVMVPAGEPTQATIDQLGSLLAAGDLIIDGGNSKYTDDQKHADALSDKGIGFVDCGVSGGIWGITEGYALMAGGSKSDVAKVQPIFDALKPDGDGGFVHAGPVGAGHFVKMVHNGIEYGLMEAYAEGYELLEKSPLVENVPDTIKSWTKGTVIRSWLLDLLVRALDEDPDLSELRGYAQDSGEGRWTIEAAIDNAVPMPVITSALYARFSSRQVDSPAMKVVAALRQQFGGHPVDSVGGSGNIPIA